MNSPKEDFDCGVFIELLLVYKIGSKFFQFGL